MSDYIRCHIENQSHYVEATLLSSLILRILDDQRHAHAVTNAIRFLVDVGSDRGTKAVWINVFGFSPVSVEAVEYVFSQANPPTSLRSMLSRLVLSRPPIQRIGIGHLLVGSDGIPDKNAVCRIAALQQAVGCLPKMRADLIAKDASWRQVGGLGKGLVFWRDPLVLALVPCGAMGWLQ